MEAELTGEADSAWIRVAPISPSDRGRSSWGVAVALEDCTHCDYDPGPAPMHPGGGELGRAGLGSPLAGCQLA